MQFVTFLWSTEYEHLNLAKLMYPIEAPVHDKMINLATLQMHCKINLNAEHVEVCFYHSF